MIVEQLTSDGSTAIVREIDEDGYFEGYDNAPHILSAHRIGRPALATLIEKTVAHALVLDSQQSEDFSGLARRLSLDELRSRGLALREQGSGLGFITL